MLGPNGDVELCPVHQWLLKEYNPIYAADNACINELINIVAWGVYLLTKHKKKWQSLQYQM